MEKLEIVKEIAIFGAFVTCVYFGFKYDSGWAFFGAVIAFLNIAN